MGEGCTHQGSCLGSPQLITITNLSCFLHSSSHDECSAVSILHLLTIFPSPTPVHRQKAAYTQSSSYSASCKKNPKGRLVLGCDPWLVPPVSPSHPFSLSFCPLAAGFREKLRFAPPSSPDQPVMDAIVVVEGPTDCFAVQRAVSVPVGCRSNNNTHMVINQY